MSELVFPNRMVHLDFHTSPAIPDVGRDFDAKEFARTFKDAHVDSVTLFAKCHHGHLYYDTDHPARHPGLRRDLDLLGEQIEALHAEEIRAPIYISGPVDEFAATTHPEWVALDPATSAQVGGGVLNPRWQVLDMSSPYQDYLAEQIAEVLEKFAPTDGIFLDMCWDQPSVSRWAIDGMRNDNLDPESPDDRARYARLVTHRYMKRFRDMVEDAHKGHPPAGIWFNSRPKTMLFEEKKYLRHVEIESLPTGGWGYAYFPYVARFVRPLKLPTLRHTARFHRSWGDFGGLKPEAALKYECCLILSQGMTSGIGDQLHPRGVLESATYEQIGRVYSHIKDCEPWVQGGELVSEVGVLVDPALGDSPGPAGVGLVRALQQLRVQFDLITPGTEPEDYEVVIVPENAPVSEEIVEYLRTYLAEGGSLLLSGRAAIGDDGKPILPELGITCEGESPFKATYLRPAEALSRGIPAIDHVMYERGLRMRPIGDSETLCSVVEPYFDRAWNHFCSHAQTPPDSESEYAAVVQNGRTITFAVPIFEAYGKHGSPVYRTFLGNALRRLLSRPIIIDDGPTHLEATVVRTPERTVVHLISFIPERRADGLDIIEDAFPLVDVPLKVRLDGRPSRAILAPGGREIPFTWQDGYAHVEITETNGHVMVVFE